MDCSVLLDFVGIFFFYIWSLHGFNVLLRLNLEATCLIYSLWENRVAWLVALIGLLVGSKGSVYRHVCVISPGMLRFTKLFLNHFIH